VAAGKCYRGSILRPIVAAGKFVIFFIFRPFFAAAKLMFSCSELTKKRDVVEFFEMTKACGWMVLLRH
jgi:hypothetical protein